MHISVSRSVYKKLIQNQVLLMASSSNEEPLWTSVTKMACELYTSFYQLGGSWFRVLVPRQERSVANQVVLITGSSSNLGRQLALRFARRGARLVLWDSEFKEQEVTKDLVTKDVKGARVNGYVLDFLDTNAARSTADLVKKDVGPVDLVVHTIGSQMQDKKLAELKNEDMEHDFNENVLSLFNVAESLLPQMVSTGRGQFVSLAGLGGHLGLPRLTSYCSSKYAVVGFLDSLRAELKSEGLNDITITELSPFHCLPGVHLNGNKAMLESCTNYIADEAVKRILRNESKIMVPFMWASLLMSLKL